MKKTILINSFGNEKWVGGLYYRRNIAFQLTMNDYITDRYNIAIYTSNSAKDIYSSIPGIKIISVGFRNRIIRKTIKGLLCVFRNVKIEFPLYREKAELGIIPVSWIPDFQHKYYPQYFSSREIDGRDAEYNKYGYSKFPLVLSSNNALNDFDKFYNKKENVYVVPFVSFIEPEIRSLTTKQEQQICNTYGLYKKNYAVIMNQFWQHKNHVVVLKAIKEYFNNHPDSDFIFVFTGQMEDYRNQEYIDKLKEIAASQSVAPHIKILGFIERKEQIALMKNAAFVIQPSLFEGWGTVVEDAKVLDKTILLSDIPLHHEQMNEKCILFDPYDSSALAKQFEVECVKEHYDNVEKGIADMYIRAKEYSRGFEYLLKDLEKKG